MFYVICISYFGFCLIFTENSQISNQSGLKKGCLYTAVGG